MFGERVDHGRSSHGSRKPPIEWPVPKSETVPRPVKVSNPFCFDDPQVVLQASRIQVPSLVVLLAF